MNLIYRYRELDLTMLQLDLHCSPVLLLDGYPLHGQNTPISHLRRSRLARPHRSDSRRRHCGKAVVIP